MVIDAEEARGQLDDLVERAAAGEEVVLTRDGLPIAKLVELSAGGPPTAGVEAPDE